MNTSDSFAADVFLDEKAGEGKVINVNHLSTKTMRISEKDANRRAEKVAALVLEKKENKATAEDNNSRKLLSQLTGNGSEYMCMSCVKYAHCSKVPQKLTKMSVGKFGFFKHLDGTRAVNEERRRIIKVDFTNPLHIW